MSSRTTELRVDVAEHAEQLVIGVPNTLDIRAGGNVRDLAGGERHIATESHRFERVQGATHVHYTRDVLWKFAQALSLKVLGSLVYWVGGDYSVYAKNSITFRCDGTIIFDAKRVIGRTEDGAYIDLTNSASLFGEKVKLNCQGTSPPRAPIHEIPDPQNPIFPDHP